MKSISLPPLLKTAPLQSLGVATVAVSFLWANPGFAATLVATELVLSVDVSASVTAGEFNLQRQGYENAFRDASIIDQISDLKGGIAATLVYWASSAVQATDWFHITDAASANAFADAIAAVSTKPSGIGSTTNIADGIDLSRELLLNNEFEGNMVIDVSGDGEQNTDCPFTGTSFDCIARIRSSRDAAAAAGITINGLPILTDFADLDDYFLENVITGSNGFVIPASDFDDFGDAVKDKIGREIAVIPDPDPDPDPDPNPDPVDVPEPATLLGLAALGMFGLGAHLKNRRVAENA